MTITPLPLPRRAPSAGTVPAVLIFPGQGSQWPGMAADLLDASPVFTARLRECGAAVARYVGWDVESVLRQRPGAPTLDRVEIVQPTLWAVHVALAALWLANGLAPQAVVGQSQGEIAAACVSGALTLDDAARVITLRSQLFAQTLVGTGAIASIRLSASSVAPLLQPFGGRLEIAGDIGPCTSTVAGDLEPLETLLAQLNTAGVKANLIPATIPTHCFAVDALHDRLTALLAPVCPRPTRIPMYSTVTAGPVDGRTLNADYWCANARRPVLFQPALRSLVAHGARLLVECSAHPVLISATRAIAADAGIPVRVTGTLRRGYAGLSQFEAAMTDAGLPGAVTPAA